MQAAPVEFLDTVELIEEIAFPALPFCPLPAVDVADECLDSADGNVGLESRFERFTGAYVWPLNAGGSEKSFQVLEKVSVLSFDKKVSVLSFDNYFFRLRVLYVGGRS